MSKLPWIRHWCARPAAAQPARHRATVRPALEALEDRCLLSAGTLDPTFNGTGRQTLAFPGGSVTGTAVAVQPDNKVVVAGTFQPTGSTTTGSFAVARFNADGSLDTGFGTGGRVTIDFGFPGGNQQASAVALQADGKIVVGGSVATGGPGGEDFAVARLTAAGALDGSFGAGGKQTLDFGFDDFLTGLAIQPADQKVVLAGYGKQGGGASFEAARLGTDGSLDASFGSGGKEVMPVGAVGMANAVALQADGKIVLAGATGPSGGPDDFAAVRLTAGGTVDTSFGAGGTQALNLGGDDQASAVALQGDGKIVLAGSTTTSYAGQPDSSFAAARLNADGSPDTSFGSGGTVNLAALDFGSPSQQGSSRATGVVVEPTGKILLAGYRGQLFTPNTSNLFVLVHLTADGSPDTSFNPTFGGTQRAEFGIVFAAPAGPGRPSQAKALALDPVGRPVLVGSSAPIITGGATPTTGAPSIAVARLKALADPPTTTASMFDPATGTWYLGNVNSFTSPDIPPFRYGAAGWVPLMGDWNGQGAATIGVFDPATATWYLKDSNGAGAPDVTPFAYGGANWIPVVGDWTGSGKTTIGVVDPSTMTWYLKNSNSAGAPDIAPFRYGQPGDIPVVGDWDASGTFTIGVYRPSTATWYLRNSNSPGAPDIPPFAYGASYMKPVVGDWAGKGRWTVGVYDPSGNGAWLLRASNDAGGWDVPAFAYGASTWTPVARPPGASIRLLAAGGEGPGAAALSGGDLNATLAAALGRLQQAGVSPAVLSRLSEVTAVIEPLAPGQLGKVLFTQNEIVLSPDGAGHGWFVDPTPNQDEEFSGGSAFPGSPALGREDLLTAVLHELGQIAGLPNDSGSTLMAESLPTGTRRTDALGAVFAGLNS
jgi:uncharacterized delta-60 repeat protein